MMVVSDIKGFQVGYYLFRGRSKESARPITLKKIKIFICVNKVFLTMRWIQLKLFKKRHANSSFHILSVHKACYFDWVETSQSFKDVLAHC